MRKTIISLATESGMRALGAAIGEALQPGDIVSLTGPLGAGKTTLARAAIERRCGARDVPSPTFTLVEIYTGPDLAIWHFDFYRLEKPDDAWELGLEDALAEGASLIEWPERAPVFPAEQALTIELLRETPGRRAVISAPPDWEDRLAIIAASLENQPKGNP